MQQIMDLLSQLVHSSDLAQLAMILLVVIIISGVVKRLKQPLIIWYLLAGIAVWPMLFGLAELSSDGHSFIELFSHLWISLLLFMVGLGLNINVIKEQGKVALGIWTIQILSSAAFGFLAWYFLGYDMMTSIYIGIWLTFSSTIVIVKLLSDKEEDETMYGRIAIGLLIVQDLVVMVLLMLLAIKSWGDWGGFMLLEWFMLLAIVILFSKFILPKLVVRLADNQEFLVLIGIWRCLILWTFFQLVGFSFEIWCLLAWMSFATSPFRMQISSKLKPLRDFFLVLFFIALWLQLSPNGLTDHLPLLIISIAFVLIWKPLIVFWASKLFGFTNQISMKAWMAVGQISEFSFLILWIGIAVGHVTDPSLISLMVLIGLVTIAVSSYSTMHNNWMYEHRKRYLGKNSVESDEELEDGELEKVEVILFGYGRIWARLWRTFDTEAISHVIIDHNPLLTQTLEESPTPYIFADATNTEVYRHMFHPELKMVVSTIRDVEDDLLIIDEIQRYNKDIIIVVVSNRPENAMRLYTAWADYVIMPDYISAQHTSVLVEDIWFDVEKFVTEKLVHVEELKEVMKSRPI